MQLWMRSNNESLVLKTKKKNHELLGDAGANTLVFTPSFRRKKKIKF
jgi:hypothetical protein